MDDLSKKTHIPNLGQLSLAVLEHLVEPVIGKKAIEKIKSPSSKRILRKTLGQALKNAENRFVVEYRNTDVSQALLSLPLADLPSIVLALLQFYSQPTSREFEKHLSQQIKVDFPRLNSSDIDEGVSKYLIILREELVSTSSEYRQVQGVLAGIRTESNTQVVASRIDDVFLLLSDYIETEKFRVQYSKRLALLKKDLREKRDMRKLKISIAIAENYAQKGILSPSVEDMLINAQKRYEETVLYTKRLQMEQEFRHLGNAYREFESLLGKIKGGTETYFANVIDPVTGEYEQVKRSMTPFLEQIDRGYRKVENKVYVALMKNVDEVASDSPFLASKMVREALKKPFRDSNKEEMKKKLLYLDELTSKYELRIRGV